MFKSFSVFVTAIMALVSPELHSDALSGLQPTMDSDFYDNGSPPASKVELGRFLFFDKILSGNLNVSCATCHHALAGRGTSQETMSRSAGEDRQS